MRILNKKFYDSTTFVTTSNSAAVDISHMAQWTATATWTNSTPSNKSFVDGNVTVAADTVTITSHSFVTGLAVTLTTSGVLPGGLATATTYYLIVVDANTIKFATNLVNALAGTAIDITSAAGGGTHNVVVTALAGGSVKLQLTNDDCNDTTVTPVWYDITGKTANITATGTTVFSDADIGYRFIRAVATVTAGYVTISSTINAKGFSV